MAVTKTTNTEGIIAKASTQVDKKKEKTIKDYIKLYEKEIAKALPSILTPERFTRMAMTAITQTPKLETCSPRSLIAAMLNAAQLGLEPNTPLGQAYLIPYGNKCQFQVGYKGLIDLAYRGGQIKKIEAHCVYENDKFEFEYGIDEKLKHIPAMENRGDAILYYAIYKLESGQSVFTVMSKEDIVKFATTKSKTYNNGPWQTDFDEMAKKTVIKKLLKYAPLKTELAMAVKSDLSIQSFEVEDEEIKIIPEDVIDEQPIEINESEMQVNE
ncbi:MAG: recombinase RecT [Treponema sp.]|nr:recombinase RecT [Treponema sp.]